MNGLQRSHLTKHFELENDWRGYALVALFAVVITGALLARPMWINSGVEPAFAGASTAEQAATGGIWALAEAAFAGLLISLILLYRWLPKWVQNIVEKALTMALWMWIGAAGYIAGYFWTVMLAGVGLFALLKTAERLDLWWTINNIMVLGIAIYMAAWIGVVLSPWILAAGLVGLSVYDYVFADRESWMFTLAGSMLAWKLPVIFILPEKLRFDWDALTGALSGDVDEDDAPELALGIGTADLLIPAAFVVSLVPVTPSILHTITIAAVIGGILLACFRVSWKMVHNDGGAGLPPLTSGAIGGWAIGTVVVLLL